MLTPRVTQAKQREGLEEIDNGQAATYRKPGHKGCTWEPGPFVDSQASTHVHYPGVFGCLDAEWNGTAEMGCLGDFEGQGKEFEWPQIGSKFDILALG